MSPGPRRPPPLPTAAELTRHRTLLRRLLVVHALAYLPAFAAAFAAIPIAARHHVDAGGSGEVAPVVGRVVTAAVVPFAVVLVLAHGCGLPWVLARDGAYKRLALGVPLAATGLFLIAAGWLWARLLSLL